MDCRTMMAPIETGLFADDPAGKAIEYMVEGRRGLMPVTERDGTFIGLISGDSLIHALIPKSISAMSRVKRGMRHASYLDESAEEMQERLDAVRAKTIGELADRHVKTVHPETPLIDGLILISGKQYLVPVVDKKHKLLGVISFFSVLDGLRAANGRGSGKPAKGKRKNE